MTTWWSSIGIDGALKASEAILKATSSLAEELAEFACQRLRTDVETGGALLNSSNDWGQAVNLQGKFAVDAVRDYLEEMTKVTQLAAQTTRDVWGPLQEFSTRLARGEVGRPSSRVCGSHQLAGLPRGRHKNTKKERLRPCGGEREALP